MKNSGGLAGVRELELENRRLKEMLAEAELDKRTVPQDGDTEKGEVTTAVTRIRPDTAIDHIFSLLVARDNQPVTFREMEEAGVDCRSARQCVYASARRMAAFERTKQGRQVAVKLKPIAYELLQKKYGQNVRAWVKMSAHRRPTTATEPAGSF